MGSLLLINGSGRYWPHTDVIDLRGNHRIAATGGHAGKEHPSAKYRHPGFGTGYGRGKTPCDHRNSATTILGQPGKAELDALVNNGFCELLESQIAGKRREAV